MMTQMTAHHCRRLQRGGAPAANHRQMTKGLARSACCPKVSASLLVNSLGPNDAIWRQESGSTLAQVMACCLTAPSHYLNKCCLSSEMSSDIPLRTISQVISPPSITEISLKIIYAKFHWNLPGVNDLALNMLNCFENYKRCVHISYHILDFHNGATPYVAFHILWIPCCWCPGDLRSWNIPSPASVQLTLWPLRDWWLMHFW